jgi:hypothetical protein
MKKRPVSANAKPIINVRTFINQLLDVEQPEISVSGKAFKRVLEVNPNLFRDSVPLNIFGDLFTV